MRQCTELVEGSKATLQPHSTNQLVTVTLWGSGSVYREFLHVDDMAGVCAHIMENVEAENLYDELAQLKLW